MSEIKPIRSEADYDAAVAQVEQLWGARMGTPEGDRLDVLATLPLHVRPVNAPAL